MDGELLLNRHDSEDMGIPHRQCRKCHTMKRDWTRNPDRWYEVISSTDIPSISHSKVKFVVVILKKDDAAKLI